MLELPESAVRKLAMECGLRIRDRVNSSAGKDRLKLNRVTPTGQQCLVVWDDTEAPEDAELCVLWDFSVDDDTLTELICESNVEAL